METVFVVEGNEEGKWEESGVEKSSSSLSSPKQIADPVVYKLVRVCYLTMNDAGGSSSMCKKLEGKSLISSFVRG